MDIDRNWNYRAFKHQLVIIYVFKGFCFEFLFSIYNINGSSVLRWRLLTTQNTKVGDFHFSNHLLLQSSKPLRSASLSNLPCLLSSANALGNHWIRSNKSLSTHFSIYCQANLAHTPIFFKNQYYKYSPKYATEWSRD